MAVLTDHDGLVDATLVQLRVGAVLAAAAGTWAKKSHGVSQEDEQVQAEAKTNQNSGMSSRERIIKWRPIRWTSTASYFLDRITSI